MNKFLASPTHKWIQPRFQNSVRHKCREDPREVLHTKLSLLWSGKFAYRCVSVFIILYVNGWRIYKFIIFIDFI